MTAGNCSIRINGNGGLEVLLCLDRIGRQNRGRAVKSHASTKSSQATLIPDTERNMEKERCMPFLHM